MKKVILTSIASGLFMLALVFSFNTNTSEVTFGEEAFADGTCCKDKASICIIGNIRINDRYFWNRGPCPVIAEPGDVQPVGGDAQPVNN